MPLQTVSYRPQTSRQAKRAYQKAGATPRLSAVEQRRIERAAELEERAARIRAHNLRARENKRRKAEKLEREREARKRMGIPDQVKKEVGPSQLSLGEFVNAGSKWKSERSCSPVLQPSIIHTADCADSVSETDRQNKPAAASSSPNTPKPHSSPKQSVIPRSCMTLCKETNKKPIPSASLMPPPPPRVPVQKVLGNPIARSKLGPSMSVLNNVTETDWNSIFDSNTQVAREISDPHEKPLVSSPHLKKPLEASTTPPLTVPVDFLNGICTQDLQYSSSPPLGPAEAPPDTGAPVEYKQTAASTSFDEFDDNELSSQDLRELYA
ncbi:MAG: hypothetical protein Q9201_002425 [Fulgogasparrea decipioides]